MSSTIPAPPPFMPASSGPPPSPKKHKSKKKPKSDAPTAATSPTPAPAPPPAPLLRPSSAPPGPNPNSTRRSDGPWRGGGGGGGGGGRGGPGAFGTSRGGRSARGSSSLSPARGRGGADFRQGKGAREMSDFARRAGEAGEGDGQGGEGKSSGPPNPRRRPPQRRGHPNRQPGDAEGEDDCEPSSADESGPLLARVSRAPGETLRHEIMHLYQAQTATEAALEARDQLIHDLNVILNREPFKWGHQHSSRTTPLVVQPFGSVRFGLSTSASDLDLCIFDPYRPEGFDQKFFRTATNAAEDLPTVYDMNRIAAVLRRNHFTEVRAIPYAAVPICKFKATLGGETIEVDINTNERLGVLNSRLLNSYCNLHPAVRPLCVFIKFWARQRELNDPSGKKGPVTFSSYTLILLIIAYLQSISFLPNLQDPLLISATSTPHWRFWTRPRGSGRTGRAIQPSVGWDVTFVEKIPPGLDWQTDDVSVDALARGFFQYYADEFDVGRKVVSVQNGMPMERERPFRADEVRREEEAKRVKEVKRRADLEVERKRRRDIEDGIEPAPAPAGPATPKREEEPRPPRRPFGSRSSSPVEAPEFEEPAGWTQKLIVQDPFILTRNTATNVVPYVVDELLAEMRRALQLIDAGEPLSKICASIKSEPHYKALAARRHSERRKVDGWRAPPAKIVVELQVAELSLEDAPGESGGVKAEEKSLDQPAVGEPVEDGVASGGKEAEAGTEREAEREETAEAEAAPSASVAAPPAS